MVLRDERDKLTSKRLYNLNTKADANWTIRKSKTHRRKSRINKKKNIGNPIVLTSTHKTIIKTEVEKDNDVCSICCESTKNLKYINCKLGGTQNVNFGKYGECCKDKPICRGCRHKCSKCPFCKEHSLRPLKNRFPQKKPTFALRQERIKFKKGEKEKRREAMLLVPELGCNNVIYSVSSEMNRRLMTTNTYVPTVYIHRDQLRMREHIRSRRQYTKRGL